MGLGGTKGNAALLLLGKPKGEAEEHDDGEGDGDVEVSDDELEAMKVFEDAKTTEDKAKALKAFMKLCEY